MAHLYRMAHSAQREVELGADLDELRQLGRELDGIAVGHQLGPAFEDGDAALVVEIRADRQAGISAREQRPADRLRDDAILAADLRDVEMIDLVSGEQEGVLVLEPRRRRRRAPPASSRRTARAARRSPWRSGAGRQAPPAGTSARSWPRRASGIRALGRPTDAASRTGDEGRTPAARTGARAARAPRQ